MKGLADKPSYIIELLEGGVTLEDVIDGHICEQALVSSARRPFNSSPEEIPKVQMAFTTVSLVLSSDIQQVFSC